MQLKVTVKTLGNRVLPPFEVNGNDRVEEFQAMLEHIVPIGDQVLLLKDKDQDKSEMTPGHLLCHYNLNADDEVLLVRRLPERPDFSPPCMANALANAKTSMKKGVAKCTKGKQAAQSVLIALPPIPHFPPPQSQVDPASDNSPSSLREALFSSLVPVVRPPPAVPVATCLGASVPSSKGHSTPVTAVQTISAPSSLGRSSSGIAAPPAPVLPLEVSGKAREDCVNAVGAAAPGTPRCGGAGPSGTLSQPCTPRTPATPNPVVSWAPPPMTAPKAAPLARTAHPQEGCMPGNTRNASGSAASSGAVPPVAAIRPPPTNQRIRRADLQQIGRLGVGAFGVVTLEMDRRTQRTYALKAVSKGYLAQLHMEHSVLNEKRILKMVETPFIVRLLATYNGREHVYFLLEAALGGELFTTYERLRLYGSEPHARFYVACCVEAIAHLHERNVIYRDLKPENLLLDNMGYCKLTDMGLAKVTTQQTYTLVGTPDYMAPEVINCTGHNKSVDWWMLGVLLFELLVGRPPFEADSTEKVYEAVRKGINAVRFPEACRRAADLVRALCHHEPEERIRADATRSSRWFREFDWAALRALKLPAPHLPRVRGPRDLTNFRSCDEEDPPRVPYKDKGTGWDLGFEDDTPNPAVAASVGALPADTVAKSASTSQPPQKSNTKPSGATATSMPVKAAPSPRQATRVPQWAWTTSACPTKPVAGLSQPMLHTKQTHSSMKAATAAWVQKDVPTSPQAPAAGGG